jgi:hypothetical protein
MTKPRSTLNFVSRTPCHRLSWLTNLTVFGIIVVRCWVRRHRIRCEIVSPRMTLYLVVQAEGKVEIQVYLTQQSVEGISSGTISHTDRPNLPFASALVRELLH